MLHVFSYFRPDFTGEGLYLEKLAQHLQALGIEGDVLVGRTKAARHIEPGGALRLRIYFGDGRTKLRLFYPAMLAWFGVNAWRYGVVHFHGAVDRLFLFHLVARAFGCRVVHSSTLDDGLGSLVNGYRKRFRRITRLLCRSIDAAISISPYLYQDSLTILPAERLHFIPQGVNIPEPDPEKRRADRASLGLTDADVVLVFVGSVSARKDVKFLVQNHPAPTAGCGRVCLIVVGPELDAEYAAEVRSMAAASSARDNIHFVGHAENPSVAYNMADIFVFASVKEGFGNVLIEAMSHGLPVISRRLPGVNDSFIVHQQTGYLFDDAAEYREILAELVRDPGLRRKTGAAARDVAIRDYSLSEMARRYASLYRGLVSNRRA
ncbi:MAG TPA: glycosyltransferase family 4 protein [Acetobacteraceae bacterium]|nr:glycosyltransferase family 4 protein [Acetobacteraceae bacterium]